MEYFGPYIVYKEQEEPRYKIKRKIYNTSIILPFS